MSDLERLEVLVGAKQAKAARRYRTARAKGEPVEEAAYIERGHEQAYREVLEMIADLKEADR